MNTDDPREIWRSSLRAMRNSLLGTYEITTTAEEQRRFLQCWTGEDKNYDVFAGYRRNEGRRRILDILEVIDEGIRRLEECDMRTGAKVFHETVEQVALFSRVAQLLELSNEPAQKRAGGPHQ